MSDFSDPFSTAQQADQFAARFMNLREFLRDSMAENLISATPENPCFFFEGLKDFPLDLDDFPDLVSTIQGKKNRDKVLLALRTAQMSDFLRELNKFLIVQDCSIYSVYPDLTIVFCPREDCEFPSIHKKRPNTN